MLAIWTETVWLGGSVPLGNVVAFIAGFAMSVGTCMMAAALLSPGGE
jgi:multisubunit Na+/H+ antiporter MnhB subunit